MNADPKTRSMQCNFCGHEFVMTDSALSKAVWDTFGYLANCPNCHEWLSRPIMINEES